MKKPAVNSLKSKIWLATGALVFFIFGFGISSWLIVSLFTENSFFVALLRLLFSALAVVVYGRWLAEEVTRPIEKVALLAKSLERGNSTSLPKTSGSAETDDVLETLFRSNQQMQNLVGLMDKVSGGELDVALAPLQHNDRLSVSFQKLLAKVTESINAKQDLERLEKELRQISEEAGRVRNGNFDVEIKSDFEPTKEISETLKFLIFRLNELVARVKNESKQNQAVVKEVQKTLQNIAVGDENRIWEMQQMTRLLKHIPQSAEKISQELFSASQSARQSIERARGGSKTAQQNLSAVNALRSQIREAVKRIGRLEERTREIEKVARTMEDFAQRTNTLALNASLQTPGRERDFAAFSEEMERVAERAARTNKQISTLNQTIAAEIGEIERSLQESVGEAANLSRFAIETGSSLSELEKYIRQFLDLQEKLVVYAGEQSADTETAFKSFVESIEETQNAVGSLKESETQIALLAISMENLQLAVADFKTPSAAVIETSTTRSAENSPSALSV